MRMTEWVLVKDGGFEETTLLMENGQTLFVLRRWNESTKNPENQNTQSVHMGVIRAGHDMCEVCTFPYAVTREEMFAKIKLVLGMPINDFKIWMRINTPQICGMFPKKFREEVKRFSYG